MEKEKEMLIKKSNSVLKNLKPVAQKVGKTLGFGVEKQ